MRTNLSTELLRVVIQNIFLLLLGVCLYMMLCKVNPFQDSPLEESATGDYSFHSLLSCHFKEMTSLPVDGLSVGKKEEQIKLAKEMLGRQIDDQWQVPQSIGQITSASTLHLLQRLLTYNPQERVNISQTLDLLRNGSTSV